MRQPEARPPPSSDGTPSKRIERTDPMPMPADGFVPPDTTDPSGAPVGLDEERAAPNFPGDATPVTMAPVKPLLIDSEPPRATPAVAVGTPVAPGPPPRSGRTARDAVTPPENSADVSALLGNLTPARGGTPAVAPTTSGELAAKFATPGRPPPERHRTPVPEPAVLVEAGGQEPEPDAGDASADSEVSFEPTPATPSTQEPTVPRALPPPTRRPRAYEPTYVIPRRQWTFPLACGAAILLGTIAALVYVETRAPSPGPAVKPAVTATAPTTRATAPSAPLPPATGAVAATATADPLPSSTTPAARSNAPPPPEYQLLH